MGKNKNNAPKSSKKKTQNLGEQINIAKGCRPKPDSGTKVIALMFPYPTLKEAAKTGQPLSMHGVVQGGRYLNIRYFCHNCFYGKDAL
jgi:hypothetical protein